METRILSTELWRDDSFIALEDKEKVILWFLLCNDRIPTLPAYKISQREIAFFCSTTVEKVNEVIPKLKQFGVFLVQEYFLITDKFTRPFYTGGKTEKARERLWNSYPDEIKKLVDVEGRIGQSLGNHCSTIGSINHKPETINHKSEIINQKPETRNQKPKKKFSKLKDITEETMKEIADKYQVPIAFVRSKLDDLEIYCGSKNKQYSNYKLTLMHWVKRDYEEKEKNSGSIYISYDEKGEVI